MGALDTVKEVAGLVKKLGDIELYKKILDAEDAVRELTREKRQLGDRVSELEASLKVRAAMTFKAPFYYQPDDATPFCAPCYEKDGRTVHLGKSEKGNWRCMVCGQFFSIGPRKENRQSGYDLYAEENF